MRIPVAVFAAVLLTACASPAVEPPSGRQVFQTHCAVCHGPAGEGDGPVAAELIVPVPDLRGLNQRYGRDFPADEVAAWIDGRRPPAAHGSRAMPVWGEVFETTGRLVPGAGGPAGRIDALIDYLRTIQN